MVRAPRAVAAAVTSPVPQQMSSTLIPATTPAASSSASTKGAVACAKVASYSAAACCQPACSNARTASGSNTVTEASASTGSPQGPSARDSELVNLVLFAVGLAQLVDREAGLLRGLDQHLLAPGQQIDRRRDLRDRVGRDHHRAVPVGVD